MARLNVGHIAHLGVGDMQESGQLGPVCRRLVEQHKELGVCEHHARRVGGQAFLHVLRGGCQNTAVLAKTLPRLV